IRCVCGKKIGPDPRNFNQRVSLGRNDLLIRTFPNKLKSREITFQEYRRNLAKAGVFRWVTNIHEQKRYYYTFDNSLLFTESIQKTTQILPR
ncbi:DUF1398 family protein, partial [Escherichia coli]|uniref:DUF1398 family protein n=1 Tax=Escherichia coli TaxID=562 RepID=UPI00200BF02C